VVRVSTTAAQRIGTPVLFAARRVRTVSRKSSGVLNLQRCAQRTAEIIMKKLSTLLAQRQAVLHQARLANLAFAYRTLGTFERRIARAQLSGRVMLKPAAPQAERYWANLVALEGNQSVLEEHFTEEDLMDLADVLGFVTGHESADITFRLEEVAEIFVTPLRVELEREGVKIDERVPVIEE
jgi:hypothetical protein